MVQSSTSAGEPLWAGVDVGTQSLRVAVVDADGGLAGQGSAKLSSRRAPGRIHEQDPASWWRALGAAARAALDGLAAERLRGVALCSTSGTVLLTDGHGAALTPALMYDDARAEAEERRAAEAGGALWAALGLPMQRSWALPKVLWLLGQADAATRQAAERGGVRLAHSADYLAGRLVGAPVATDFSHALKTGYDLSAHRWPTEVLDRLGLPLSMLPDVVRPGSRLGAVSARAAGETGFPAGTPVLAGMTDGCAAQVAAGALSPGDWNSVLGTTLVLKGVTTERLSDPGGAVYSHRHPDGGWLPGGASNVGAGSIPPEFRDDPAAFDAAAEAFEPAGAVAYPLVSRGERFPFVRPDAQGFLLGRPRSRADRYAALLQGVAFVERLCYAYVETLGAKVDGRVMVTGGGSRSAYWTQLRADVLGRPLHRPAQAEPAFGMAVLAAAGNGSLSVAARRMVRLAGVVEPRPAAAERFAEPYAKFLGELVLLGYIDERLARCAA
ncbi:FGGY-family carbohydrate kinase [Actinoplanes sp. NPDC051513]|uniref:FGGY-family carbohydrate kinase n=1 Tax=Actinoplanes sp. NPDC051513 TaxID=3363908 RepID=UPI00379C2E4F